jgi:hypothetical protein
MKVRVEQIGEVYYPQYRRMCLWRNFQTQASVVPGHTYDINVRFSTLAEAIAYAKQFDNVIHEVN